MWPSGWRWSIDYTHLSGQWTLLLSSSQSLPSLSMSLKAPCRLHHYSSLGVTVDSHLWLTPCEMFLKRATAVFTPFVVCIVYWPTSPRWSCEVSLPPDWTCGIPEVTLTSFSMPRTTWPGSSANGEDLLTFACWSDHSTGIQQGSRLCSKRLWQLL